MVVVYAFNPSMREEEAGGFLRVRGQPVVQELGSKATEKPSLEKTKKEKRIYPIP